MEAKIAKIGYSLKAVLDEEIDLLSNLHEVMEQENRLLLESSTSHLFELNKTKELLILQHSYLDRTRRNHTVNLSKVLKLENSEPKLAVLVELMEGKLAKQIGELQVRLRQLVDNIQQLSAENSKLIECSISAVQDSWGMLKRQFVNLDKSKKHGQFKKGQEPTALLQGRI